MQKKKMIRSIVALITMIAMAFPASSAFAVVPDNTYTFYMVPNAHIDTAWMWPYQHTADTVIRDTYKRAIDALKSNSSWKFSTSASKHYEWVKEYYPDYWQSLKELVANGQWDITGGQIVEPDLNLISGESFVRQSLYAQRFFAKEFPGHQPVLAYVPDVFGFSGQFPQIIKKSEMDYFLTSKLNWNGNYSGLNEGPEHEANSASGWRESDLIWWKGIDGTDVLSYVLPRDYVGGYSISDINNNNNVFDRNNRTGHESGIKLALGLYGDGDHGGGPTGGTGTGSNTYNFPAALNNQTQANVKSASATEFFLDVAKEDLSKVFVHEGEMYLQTHRGTYTSWSREKKYNRQNEILSEVAEKASTLSYWTGAIGENSADRVAAAWDNILINQMHDVLPGSSFPYQYYVAFNLQEMTKNLMTNVRDNALLGLAYRADTTVGDGVPVFVFNPLSWSRSDETSLTVTLPSGNFSNVKLYDGAAELPVNILERTGNTFKITFIAKDVPALGYKVFKAVGTNDAPAFASDVSITTADDGWVLENQYLKVTLNPATGNIKSLINKADGNREAFYTGDTEGNELHVYNDTGGSSYPAWDVTWAEIGNPATPFTRLNAKPDVMRIVESSKEKVTVLVSRNWGGSAISQFISLNTGTPKLDVRMEIDWNETQKMLKLSFPVLADATKASYEVAYGALQRSTLRDTHWNQDRFEQAGHKWMDVTDSSNNFGLSLLNDAKYGYDVYRMGNGGTVPYYVRARLSVLRSPISASLSGVSAAESLIFTPHNQYIDPGFQEFNYAIYPHAGDWAVANTPKKAHELCYPMTAFQTVQANGGSGSAKSFLSSDKDNVIIEAVKNPLERPEEKDTMIIRVYESSGKDTAGATITLPERVISAKEVNLLEHDRTQDSHKALTVSGNTVKFDIKHFEILTLEVKLQPFTGAAVPVTSRSADLSSFFNLDGVTDDADRKAGNLDGSGNSVPEANWPQTVSYLDVKFTTADISGDKDRKNLVEARGQEIAIPSGQYNKVFLLGAAAGKESDTGVFTVNYANGTKETKEIKFAQWNSDLSGWDRIAKMDMKPYVLDSIGYTFTHYHDGVKDQMTRQNYWFVYDINTDKDKTVTSITLPDAAGIKIAAITAFNSPIPEYASVHQAAAAGDKPLPPTGLTTALDGGNVILTWNPSVSSDIYTYKVYIGYSPDFKADAAHFAGTASPMTNKFTFAPITKGTFYFKVEALNRDMLISDTSAIAGPVTAGKYNYSLSAKSVTAVAWVNDSERPELACDGDNSTKWCVTGITTGNNRGYLNVKLVDDSAAPLSIDSFRVVHAGVAESTSYNTRNFNIDYSLNGTDWTRAFTVTNNTANITDHNLAAAVQARYVRLNVVNGEQGTSNTARIYEFAVYGDTDIEFIPVISGAKISAERQDAASTLKLSTGYTFSTGSPYIEEFGTQFRWMEKKNGSAVYTDITGAPNAASIELPFGDLLQATAIKCVVTPKNSAGTVGQAVELEYKYDFTGDNVLLNSNVVYSSGSMGGEESDKLVDGNLETKWCQRYISPAEPGVSTFDLVGVYQIEDFSIFHVTSNPNAQDYDRNPVLNTKAYKVEYSLDGVTWGLAVNEENNQATSRNYVLNNPIQARFVRLTVLIPNNCTDSTNPTMEGDMAALRIQEFQAKGKFIGFSTVANDSFIPVFTTSVGNGNVNSLSDSAGGALTASISATHASGAAGDLTVRVIAAIYDANGRLMYSESAAGAIEPGQAKFVNVGISVPAVTTGLKYQLFIWNDSTFIPLTAPYAFN